MSSNPIARTSGLPKYGVIGLPDEGGFAAQIGVAPPVATDILLQFSQGVITDCP